MHSTSQDRQEPSTSALHDSRSTNGALVLLSDVAETLDLPSPARRIIKTARQNETMDIDQAAIVSRLRDGIQPTEASASDFDPFASWDFHSARCCGGLYQPCLEIHIGCGEKWPEAIYRIAVGDVETVPVVNWCRSIPGDYCVSLQVECASMTGCLSLGVSMVCRSHQLSMKKFRLGTLEYDIITDEWGFVPRLQGVLPKSPRTTPANAEAVGNEVGSGDQSPSAVPGNNHQSELSSSNDEVVNNQTLPVNEAISQSGSITNSNSFSDRKILTSFCFMQDSYMSLQVVLEYPGGNVPDLLTSVLFFGITELESGFLKDRRSTTVKAMCSPSSFPRRDVTVYYVQLHSSSFEWYWMRAVAAHLYFGPAGPKLFVGTRRYDHESRCFAWHQASPRETCPCSSCV